MHGSSLIVPEGHKCATCKREHSDCSDLDFTKMKIIKRDASVTIVKCSEWKKK